MVNAYARATAVEGADRWLSVMEKDETWGKLGSNHPYFDGLYHPNKMVRLRMVDPMVFLTYTSEMLVPMGKMMINHRILGGLTSPPWGDFAILKVKSHHDWAPPKTRSSTKHLVSLEGIP